MTEEGTHTYLGEKTGIDHLKELGVTHVQLVEDYANMRAAEEAQKAAKETARRAFAMGLPIESVEQLVKLSTKELEKIAAEVHIA